MALSCSTVQYLYNSDGELFIGAFSGDMSWVDPLLLSDCSFALNRSYITHVQENNMKNLDFSMPKNFDPAEEPLKRAQHMIVVYRVWTLPVSSVLSPTVLCSSTGV